MTMIDKAQAAASKPALAPSAPAAAAQGPDVPEWVQDAVFYQVFPERFSNGNRGNDPFGTLPWGTRPDNWTFMGGDLEGLRQKLPYLKDLGVNALYLNPIFEANSNHKYDTNSYERVDKHFGGDKAFGELMETAREKDIRVMLDGVFNHTSHQHEWFRDVRDRGPESPYWGWYNVHNWPIRFDMDENGILRSKDYDSWWGYATLPELVTTNPEVRDYFLRSDDAVVKRWINEYGIDGWRMDVADEVELDFWQEARDAIKGANPDAYLLAEAWQDASEYVRGDTFDAAMNYRFFQQPATDFFARKNISADEFVRRLQSPYPRQAQYGAFNLLGSHDTPRFITEGGNDWYRMRPAAIFQMTYPGAPVIYYGDEIGMEGGNDPDTRRAFDWSLVAGKYGERTSDGHVPAMVDARSTSGSDAKRAAQLHGLYRTLTQTRHAEPALRRGEFQVLQTHNDDNTVSFRRWMDGVERDAVVAINNNVVGRDIHVPVGGFAPEGTPFRDALTGAKHVVTNGHLHLQNVDGNFGAVLLRDVPGPEAATPEAEAPGAGVEEQAAPAPAPAADDAEVADGDDAPADADEA